MYYSFRRIHFNFSDWLAGQQILILLVILFLSGVISGSLYSVNNENALFLSEIIKIFKESQIVSSESTFLQLVFHSIKSELIFFLPVFLFGTCALGAPAIFAVSFFKGLGLGIIMTAIYQSYNLPGLGYNVFILIPGAVLGSAALMFACKESYYMSLDMFQKLFQSNKTGKRKNAVSTFKMYCLRFCVLSIFIIMAAVADSLTSEVFGGFFKLL